MITTINLDKLRWRAQEDAKSFWEADPFPHIVFDDLLAEDIKERILSAFPIEAWDGWFRFEDKMQFKKLACDQIDRIPPPLDRILFELNSGPVLNWLSDLTGIPQLLADPWLEGGGLHSSGPGGTLVPHTDFHLGKLDHYYRRINVLLYLNTGWSKENGGALELWNKEKDCVVKEVWPEFGRCVIFQTDNRSVHGFSRPLVGRHRNSIALYYYTTTSPHTFAGGGATHWRTKSIEKKGTMGRFQKLAYRLCMGASNRFSKLAWYCMQDKNKEEAREPTSFVA